MDMNNGYVGYSMSRRAAEAYEEGEKPASKWTKGEIIAIISERFGEESAKIAERFSAAEVKAFALERRGWHHTGKMCNKTDFYGVAEDIEDPREWGEPEPRAKKTEKPAETWAIVWRENCENRGSKKWARWFTVREKCLAVLTENGSARIMTKDGKPTGSTVRNFVVIEKLSGKPRKNAKALKGLGEIEERKGYKSF